MILNLYSFAKKENSTKQPSGVPYQVTAHLKDNTEILNPVFELTEANFISKYNYVKCTIYGKERFYFVTRVEYKTNSIIYMYCEIDVLATWKSYITGTTQFVLRCSDATKYVSTLSEFLNDSANPATISAITRNEDSWDAFTRTGGYYVVGFNAKKIDHPLTVRGSVSYVVMTSTDLAMLKTNLFTLTGSLGDLAPIQYIVSCVYIPLTFSSLDFNQHLSESINLGGAYTLNIDYHSFKTPQTTTGIYTIEHDLTLNDHPDSASNGMYLNFEPYRKIHLLASSFGDFDLPISIMPNAIRYRIIIDLTDGSAMFEITDQYILDKTVFMRLNGQVGTNVALAQVVTNTTLDAYKVGSHLVSSLGSAVNLNVGNSIAEMGSAIMNAYEGNIPKLSTSGSNGSLASISSIDTNMEYVSVIDTDITHVGKPIFKNLALNTISAGSFVMCRNAIVEIDGLLEEQRLIINRMESGFYID